METNSGIDYGRGITNIDLKTGIRYGVIHQNEVLQVWCDDSEAYYGDISEDEMEFADPIYYLIDDEEYYAFSDDCGDIMIIRSPYYTKCKFCSPCAPGAGYLMDYVDGGVKAYCFGHDWFDSGKAPYPVYDVKTNKLIK